MDQLIPRQDKSSRAYVLVENRVCSLTVRPLVRYNRDKTLVLELTYDDRSELSRNVFITERLRVDMGSPWEQRLDPSEELVRHCTVYLSLLVKSSAQTRYHLSARNRAILKPSRRTKHARPSHSREPVSGRVTQASPPSPSQNLKSETMASTSSLLKPQTFVFEATSSSPPIALQITELTKSYMIWIGAVEGADPAGNGMSNEKLIATQGCMGKDWACAMPPVSVSSDQERRSSVFGRCFKGNHWFTSICSLFPSQAMHMRPLQHLSCDLLPTMSQSQCLNV
jgi:hypothetical protein